MLPGEPNTIISSIINLVCPQCGEHDGIPMLRQVPQKLALGMGMGEHGDEEFRYEEAIERSTFQGISRRP